MTTSQTTDYVRKLPGHVTEDVFAPLRIQPYTEVLGDVVRKVSDLVDEAVKELRTAACRTDDNDAAPVPEVGPCETLIGKVLPHLFLRVAKHTNRCAVIIQKVENAIYVIPSGNGEEEIAFPTADE